MEKLELKHLLEHYEDGFVQILSGGMNEKIVRLSECRIYLNPVYNKWCAQFGGESFNIPSETIKLVLRPLSDLTKEIEINNVKFIPIMELAKISDPFFRVVKDVLSKGVVHGLRYFDEESNLIVFNYSSDTSAFATFENQLKTTFITQKQLEMFQKLHEWRFDIHDLITNGLAIDNNTLKC